MSDFSYSGSELDLFSYATNWKSYWSSHIQKYLRGDVLEVGAGNGNNTWILCSKRHRRWLCMEPDKNMALHLRKSLLEKPKYKNCEVSNKTIWSLSSEEMFDTIIYIDVLEHIEEDKEELERALQHLNPGGHMIILSPALQILYSKFDKAIGHYRRYNKRTLKNIIPSNLKLERLIYLDSVGLGASIGNRFLLKQSMPSLKQIKIWDRIIIPCSKLVDPLIRYRAGKSILAILNVR